MNSYYQCLTRCLSCAYFVLLSSYSIAQAIPSSPNLSDHEGRQGRWTIYYDGDWNLIDDSTSAAFYRLINYENDKPIGAVRDFFRNGQLQMIAHLIADRPQDVMDGLCKYYTIDGAIENIDFHRGNRSTEQAIEELAADKDVQNDRRGLLALASLYHEIRSSEARPLYIKYANLTKKETGDQSLEYADALRMLAWDYLRHMDLINTEPLFFQAKNIIDRYKDQDPHLYAQMLNDIADYYTYANRYSDALGYFIEAQEVASERIPKDDYLHYIIIHNMASCYRATGDYEKALELSTIAVDDCYDRFGKFHRETANTIIALAAAKRGLGKVDEYRQDLDEVLDIYDSLYGDMHNEYLNVLYRKGRSHISSGELEEGSKVYAKVLENYLKLYGSDHPSTIAAQRSYGFSLYRLGRKDDAIRILKETAQNRQRYLYRFFDQMNEKNRQNLFFQQRSFNNFQSSLAIKERETYPELVSELLNMQLYNKALLISTSNSIKKRILESNDRKLIELYNEVQDLRQTLGNISELSDSEVTAKYQLDRDSLTEVFESKDRELNRLSSFYSTSNGLPKWESIRDRLDKKEALVEIHSYKEFDLENWKWSGKIKYIAFIITSKTKDYPQVVELSDGNYLESEALNAYSNKIRFKVKDDESYNHFWKPLERSLKKYDKVYLSSDGIYHKINLQTLFNPSTESYLMEEKDIQIITSGRDLLEERRPTSPIKFGMLIGNPSFGQLPEGVSGTVKGIELLSSSQERAGLAPLPGAEQEVETIAELLNQNGWRSIVLTNEQAEESALKDMLKPNILHIATHGFFSQEDQDEDNPLRNTGLLFTGASKSLISEEQIDSSEDGILTSFEALNLNIDNTNLVVLSACETGLGDLKNGEGIYGLQRAFKIAGARTIIMSLWKVDDEATNKLMTLFYDNWINNGMNKRGAFHEAQKQLMKNYEHPYYWGAFVVLGE